MNKFLPNMYKKDIFSIDYNSLKNKGIKVLLFDFDNTLIEKGNYSINDKTIKLISRLKKDFIVYILSNSIHKKKISIISKKLDIPYISNSRKPFKKGFRKLKLSNIKECEIAMIGDQLLTDILGGNRMNYYTILIDPINYDELIFTKLNRVLERIVLKKIKIQRGEYYD